MKIPSMNNLYVSCTNKKGNRYDFDSMKECAEFLAPRTHYLSATLKNYLSRRKTEIGEWSIDYDSAIRHRREGVKS